MKLYLWHTIVVPFTIQESQPVIGKEHITIPEIMNTCRSGKWLISTTGMEHIMQSRSFPYVKEWDGNMFVDLYVGINFPYENHAHCSAAGSIPRNSLPIPYLQDIEH